MKRIGFYLLVAALVVINALLITSPNLLGKIGLIIYKYHYLRTFPRALATVSIAVLVMLLIMETLVLLVKKKKLSKAIGTLIMVILVVGSIALLIKTSIDFMAWSYSHTGRRFRYGAYMLPSLFIMIFVYGLVKVRRVIVDQYIIPADSISKTAVNNEPDADN